MAANTEKATRIVNGCPVLEQYGDVVIIDHPQGYMVYLGCRLGTYKTLPGARRCALRNVPATKTKVTIRNGFYFIGTLDLRNGQTVKLVDVEVHNPADPSVVPHNDEVRIWARAVVSVETVEA